MAGAGRPPFEPTEKDRATVETAAGLGLPHEDICHLVVNPTTGKGIALQTLHNHFRKELDDGMAKAKLQIADNLFKQMRGGNVAAAIFLAKVRLGWSEKIRVETENKEQRSLDDINRNIANVERAIADLEGKPTSREADPSDDEQGDDLPAIH